MSRKTDAAKAAAAPAETAPAAPEQPEEATEQEPVEYVPSDDDGLTSIDDVDVDETTEVDPDDDAWGYDPEELEDLEVSSPAAIAKAEAELAETPKEES